MIGYNVAYMAGIIRSVHLELPRYLTGYELRVATTHRNNHCELEWPDEGGTRVDFVLGEGDEHEVTYGLWKNNQREWESSVYMENGRVFSVSLRPILPLIGRRDCYGISIRPSLFLRKEH